MCEHMRTCACVRVCVRACVHLCVHTHLRARVCVCMHVHACHEQELRGQRLWVPCRKAEIDDLGRRDLAWAARVSEAQGFRGQAGPKHQTCVCLCLGLCACA